MGESITAAIPKAGKREWIGLAVIALPCLTEALAPSSVQLLWIIDIYGFLLAGSLITMGTLGERIGRRRLLLIGAVLFGAPPSAARATSPVPRRRTALDHQTVEPAREKTPLIAKPRSSCDPYPKNAGQSVE
jgi:MFS family permease